MESSIDFSIAVDILNRKIAELNIEILSDNSKENQDKLNNYLNIKKEIYEGNMLVIKKIIDGEI